MFLHNYNLALPSSFPFFNPNALVARTHLLPTKGPLPDPQDPAPIVLSGSGLLLPKPWPNHVLNICPKDLCEVPCFRLCPGSVEQDVTAGPVMDLKSNCWAEPSPSPSSPQLSIYHQPPVFAAFLIIQRKEGILGRILDSGTHETAPPALLPTPLQSPPSLNLHLLIHKITSQNCDKDLIKWHKDAFFTVKKQNIFFSYGLLKVREHESALHPYIKLAVALSSVDLLTQLPADKIWGGGGWQGGGQLGTEMVFSWAKRQTFLLPSFLC